MTYKYFVNEKPLESYTPEEQQRIKEKLTETFLEAMGYKKVEKKETNQTV